ncbi:40020_t:CDS:2, partial [Gigaspora margarita]
MMKKEALKQIKEFQKIINRHFSEAPYDKQIPKALEFTLKVLKNIINNKNKTEAKEIVTNNYYISENSEELMLNHRYVSETELNHLINGYLKSLDDPIPESWKGQKAKEENDKYKTSRYYQNYTEFKYDDVESTINDMNTELPKNESKRIDIKLEDPKACVEMRNIIGCHHETLIAIAQNKEVTNKDIKSVEIEKILEVESMNARALVNKENEKKCVNKNPSLTYLSKNKKEALANLKSDSNEAFKCFKTEDIEGLKDSHPEIYRMRPSKELHSNEGRLPKHNIRTNNAELVLKDKIENDFVSRDQIKRISLKKDVSNSLKTNVSNRIAIRYKIRNENKRKKDMIFNPGGDAHLTSTATLEKPYGYQNL